MLTIVKTPSSRSAVETQTTRSVQRRAAASLTCRLAVPRHGRYVREPALTDPNGVLMVPPPVADPLPELAGLAPQFAGRYGAMTFDVYDQVIDESRRVIVGATFTGPGVAELLHSATIAIVGEVTMDQLWHAVPSFPTVSEVWLRLMEAYGL